MNNAFVDICTPDFAIIRYNGGMSCQWLNMYLDYADGEMCVTSDIGTYSLSLYDEYESIESMLKGLSNRLKHTDNLLEKVVDCKRDTVKKDFDQDETKLMLLDMYDDDEADERDMLEDILNDIDEDNFYAFEKELVHRADEEGIYLPDDWWECLCEDYTPWQKRFAEICREYIAPAIDKYLSGEMRCEK